MCLFLRAEALMQNSFVSLCTSADDAIAYRDQTRLVVLLGDTGIVLPFQANTSRYRMC